MQTLRALLREAEDALIRLNPVKARVVEEFAKQIKQEEGANASAKKRKVLGRLVKDKRKAVANMDTYYRVKLFTEPAKKKKAADKDKSEKEDEAEPNEETLVLASKRVRVMTRQKTPKAMQGKKLEKLIKKILKNTYLETIAKEEVQAIPAVARVKKIVAIKDESVENQIMYTPESAALALDATIRVFPIPEAQLEILTVPEKPNAWEVSAWKVRDALNYDQ